MYMWLAPYGVMVLLSLFQPIPSPSPGFSFTVGVWEEGLGSHVPLSGSAQPFSVCMMGWGYLL